MANAYGTNICVQGIWLRSVGDRIQVLARLADQEYVIIDVYAPLDEMTISHSVSALGIQEVLKNGPVEFREDLIAQFNDYSRRANDDIAYLKEQAAKWERRARELESLCADRL